MKTYGKKDFNHVKLDILQDEISSSRCSDSDNGNYGINNCGDDRIYIAYISC